MGSGPRTLFGWREGAGMLPRRSLRAGSVGLVALALLLAACGQAAGANGGGKLTLSCGTLVAGQGIDVITAHITCHVSGAAASDTSFTLKYHVTSDDGRNITFSSVCAGTLHNGAGSCEQTYSAPVPFPLTPGSVSGYTSPGHQALGPLTPTVRTATPAPGQHL